MLENLKDLNDLLLDGPPGTPSLTDTTATLLLDITFEGCSVVVGLTAATEELASPMTMDASEKTAAADAVVPEAGVADTGSGESA